MYLAEKYKKIGGISLESYKALLDKLSPDAWNQLDMRQKTFEVHSATQTIPLVFDQDGRHKLPTSHPHIELFSKLLVQIVSIISDFYQLNPPNMKKGGNPKSKNYLIRAILVRMSANSTINEHYDVGYSLSRCHRIHLPLVTNKNVLFKVAGEKKHLPSGELWEISNRSLHGVTNESDEDRVHLILDYVISGEAIIDPEDGLLVA